MLACGLLEATVGLVAPAELSAGRWTVMALELTTGGCADESVSVVVSAHNVDQHVESTTLYTISQVSS